MVNQEAVELTLKLGSEGLLWLTAVPVTSLRLAVAGKPRREGKSYRVKLSGEAHNLPNDTLCKVTLRVTTGAGARDEDGGYAKLAVSGTKGSMDLEIGILPARLFGEGAITIRVTPEFPFAEECKVEGEVPFRHPIAIRREHLGPSKPAAGGALRVGDRLKLVPDLGSRPADSPFHDCLLRLTLKNEGGSLHETFLWQGDLAEQRHRVGCASVDGAPALTYLRDGQEGNYRLRWDLEISADQGKTYVPARDPGAAPESVDLLRPELASFKVHCDRELVRHLGTESSWEAFRRWLDDRPEDEYQLIVARGQIANVAPDLALPIEVSLWGHRPFAGPEGDGKTRIMAPLAPVRSATIDEKGNFEVVLLDMATVTSRAEMSKLSEHAYFAVLRLPPEVTSTRAFAPFERVASYDEATFTPFHEGDLPWADETPATKDAKADKAKKRPKDDGAKKGGKRLRTMKDLGTAVCSEELRGLRPLHFPAFGGILFRARGDDLSIACRVLGDRTYWSAARPKLAVKTADGVFDLTPKPSDEDPRLLEARIPLNDKRILGKKITVTASVQNPDAKLDGNLPAPRPEDRTEGHDCSPKLGELHLSRSGQGPTACLRIACEAHHYPSFPGTKEGLSVRLLEFFEGLDNPVESARHQVEYDLRGGEGGQCDSSGWFSASITSPDGLKWLDQERFRIEVHRRKDEGKVFGAPLAPVHQDIGNERRSLKGTVVFGSVVTPEFKKGVLAICEDIGIPADFLMACMAFETRERPFDPTVRNKSTGAIGIIQFTKSIAEKRLGTTLDVLAKMTNVEQLPYVRRYFKEAEWYPALRASKKELEDVYACIFCPAAIGKENDATMYSQAKNPDAYAKNSGLDPQKTGRITKAMAAVKVWEQYHEGEKYRG